MREYLDWLWCDVITSRVLGWFQLWVSLICIAVCIVTFTIIDLGHVDGWFKEQMQKLHRLLTWYNGRLLAWIDDNGVHHREYCKWNCTGEEHYELKLSE